MTVTTAPTRADVIALLERLIAFDTTSRNSNLALIEWVEAFLAKRGVPTWRAPNADGTKSNLIARIGPEVAGGIVLSGHTDVVPVDGQPWTTDPWALTEKDGRLYGRGTSDMKSFLALALAHVDTALAAGLTRPLILAFSYDEEVGCLGAPGLIEALPACVPPPEAVIVGEPTEMQVVSGHKGISTFEVEVIGREAHSSQIGQGVSAIMAALPLMSLVAEMAQEAAAAADPTSPFVPPGATMTVGKVEGGTAVNILARRCAFLWDLRCPAGVDASVYERRFRDRAAQIEAQMRAIAPEASITVTRRSGTPPLAPQLDSPAERLARALTGDNAIRAEAYAAEAGLFQGAGLPAVLCGPGSIAQAHQPNEWIALSELDKGAAFFRGLIRQLTR
jgi:acetylornithine deacetylase